MSASQLVTRIRSEIFTWVSLVFVMSIMEGSFIGILIKNGFQGQVNDWTLNLTVAIATGAPYYANLLSFFWVKMSRGRSKAVLVSNLAIICCLCAFAISFIPMNTFGLIVLLVLLIITRVCWSGILTIRSNIWRVNYPRHIRGKVTAKMSTMAAFLMSLAALLAGWILDKQFEAFHWLYIGFAFLSIIGAFRYRFLSVRHQKKEISREKNPSNHLPMKKLFSLLTENKSFGKYMLAMFTLGTGNLMLMAPLIIYLNEYTTLSKTSQILITLAIPLGLIPIAVNWWARLLDGHHIFHFRRIHSWFFVVAISLFLIAQISHLNFIFFIGSVCYGLAISGGLIGWNLGHNDFVGKASPMEYMAVHVTLTGLRGLIAPLVGIGFYQWLESLKPGYGQYALLLPLLLSTLGGILFFYFNQQRLKGCLN